MNNSLGRGLSSLISGTPQNQNISGNLKVPYFPKKTGASFSQIVYVDPEKIKLNPHQPRKDFKEQALLELSQSIKNHGIIQPLVVNPMLGGGYELIAGERRLKAAKMAGLKEVPVIIRSAKELEKLELSLIENIQRSDLNPIEKANAYKKLTSEFNLTHEEAAMRLGISRPQFSNFLRLLALPEEIQQGLGTGKISLSQAKLMLEIKDNKKQEQVYKQTINTGATVEDVSRQIKKIKVNEFVRQIKKDPVHLQFENQMQEILGTRVKIRQRGMSGGIIEIQFYCEEELKEIVRKMI